MTHLFFQSHPIKWFRSRDLIDRITMIDFLLLVIFGLLLAFVSRWFVIPYILAFIGGIIFILKCPIKQT